MSESQLIKSILIVKSSPQALGAAEQFLRNREWSVYSTSNLKESLMYMVQKKPHFVLVGVDHPNKKIRALPKLLIQAFPVCVIAFVEQSSSQSYRLLMEAGTEYRVNPPVTGPAIERAVNKYIRDLEKKEKLPPTATPSFNPATPGERNDPRLPGSSGALAFKSDSGGAGNGNSFDPHSGGFSLEKMNSILSQIVGDSDSSETTGVTGWGESGNTGKGSDGASEQDPNQNSNSAGSWTSGGNSTGHSSASVVGSSEDFGSVFNPRGYSGENTKPDGKSKGENAKDAPGTLVKNSSGAPLPVAREIDEWSEKNSNLKVGGNPETSAGPFGGPGGDFSLFVRGAKQALEETVESRDGKIREYLQDNTQVACIIVESARFSGYLVTAMGKNRKIDHLFVKSIQSKLIQFLKDNGERIPEKETVEIKIKKVDFEQWALEKAEFLKKSVHNGDEVAMAFFPALRSTSTPLGSSASDQMASMSIDTLIPDQVVNFNVYVYLQANKKYVLYTPKGSVFYGEQKTRLKRQGIEFLHMLKSETQDLTRYKAESDLNSMIQDFENKKPTRNSA